MFTEPQILGDRDMLRSVIANERKKKEELAKRVGGSEEELRSNLKFADILRQRGIIVPTKPGKKGEIPVWRRATSS